MRRDPEASRWPWRTISRFVAWKLFWAAFVGEDKEVSLNVTWRGQYAGGSVPVDVGEHH